MESVVLGNIYSDILHKLWILNPSKRDSQEAWQWYLCLEFQGMGMAWIKVLHNLSPDQNLDFEGIQTKIPNLQLFSSHNTSLKGSSGH